jgi:uncharacterized protein (TIGR02246 family)
MAGSTPQETVDLISTYLQAGDLPALVELYAPDAVFLPDPGTVATGTEAIRTGLREFMALRPTLTFSDERLVSSDDLAVVTHRWHLRGTLPDGSPIEQRGRTINVLRRDDDGQWRLAIDNPWDAVDPAGE